MQFFRKKTSGKNGTDGISLEDMAGAKAEEMLLSLAEALEELTEDKVEGVRESLTHWLEWQLKERIAALEARLKSLAEDLASASLGKRALQWLARHGGKAEGLHGSISGGYEAQSAVQLARRFKNNTSLPRLGCGLAVMLLAVGLAVFFDFEVVKYLTFEAAGNPITGEIPPNMYWPLMAKSAMTVAAYTLASLCWHRHTTRVLGVMIYGGVFAFLASLLQPSFDGGLGGLLLHTAFYTVPGILLIVAEQASVWVVGMLRDRSHAVGIVSIADAFNDLSQARALLMQKAQDGQYVPRAVAHAMRQAGDKMQRLYRNLRDQGNAHAQDMTMQPDDQARGREQCEKATRCLDRLKDLLMVALMLSGLTLTGCRETPKAVTAQQPGTQPAQPMFVIALDGSEGSPAKDAAWVRSWFGYVIDEHVKAWPLGGFVYVMRCGDMTQTPEQTSLRIQKRGDAYGKTRKDAVAWVHERVLQMSEATRTKPYKRSELVGSCMAEVAKQLPSVAGNRVLFLTDGAEFVKGGISCEDAAKPCRLPVVPGLTFPPQTAVIMRGCGVGFPAAHGRHLQDEWFKLFERAGVEKRHLSIQA